MTETRADQHVPLRQWLGYAAIWLALVVGVAATLALAALQIALIWTVFMNLRRSSALVRLAACSAALWLVFMFALTFNDYFSR